MTASLYGNITVQASPYTLDGGIWQFVSIDSPGLDGESGSLSQLTVQASPYSLDGESGGLSQLEPRQSLWAECRYEPIVSLTFSK